MDNEFLTCEFNDSTGTIIAIIKSFGVKIATIYCKTNYEDRAKKFVGNVMRETIHSINNTKGDINGNKN